MNDNMDPTHLEWCRHLFASIEDGGVWGIPRTGLIFQKRGQTLVLTGQMPHDPAMPMTAAELAEAQEADYEATKAHFGAIGVPVAKNLTSGGLSRP